MNKPIKVIYIFVAACIVYVFVACATPIGNTLEFTNNQDGGVIDVISDTILDTISNTKDAISNPVSDAKAEVSGSRLKARWYIGDDGSKQFIGWYDSELEENCSIIPTSDDRKYCVPKFTTAVFEIYSDSNCTSRLIATQGCSDTIKYTVISTNEICDPSSYKTYYEVYYISNKIIPQVIYTKMNTECYETTPNADYDYYQIGSKVSLDTLVEFHEEVEQ